MSGDKALAADVIRTTSATSPVPPRVSVVIRCGNNAHYLHEATTSVVEQTYQDFEVIIVSDAPNAATQAQCHQLLDQLADQRLTIIQRNSHKLVGYQG